MAHCCGHSEPQYLESRDVTRHYGRWKQPDEDKAATKHRAEHIHHSFFDVWSCHVRNLKEFGVGHMMYFTFLWWMAALFCALSVFVGVPTIAINLAGKYYSSGQMEVTTLGNFGRVSTAHNHDGSSGLASPSTGWQMELTTSAAFTSDATAAPATWPFNKQSAIIAASIIDCVGAAMFFIVTLGLIVLARRRAEDADTHTVTIHDYSVYVRDLPQDATSSELFEFFSQWGEVESIELVRAYGDMLRLVLTRGKLLQKLMLAIATLQKAAEVQAQVPRTLETACHDIKNEVADLDRQIQEEQAMGDTARVVGAFVTFRTESAKVNCLKATPHSKIKQWLYLKPELKLRARYALMIKESPEPSDVQYENMEHGSLSCIGRRLITLVCSYTALGLGFFLISLATASQLNVARTAGINADDCRSCRLSVQGSLGLSDDDKVLYASCDQRGKAPGGQDCSSIDKQCYRCYCYASLTSGRLSDGSYCSSALGLLALQYSSQVGVVLAILGINMLLALTSRQLTSFEKHYTRSSEARSLAHRLFLAQACRVGVLLAVLSHFLVPGVAAMGAISDFFLNSAVSTIIASAHLPFLANLFQGTAVVNIFFQGIFTDLTPNWYKVVGRSLLISQFVGAALRMIYLLMRWGASWWSRHRRHACLTQEELESSLRGPEFLLDHRYGEHLSVIYVSMLLSGAMPIAFFTAAFWFVTSYWCDKLELLKLSRRPVVYGQTLSDHAMNLLPYAAVWHVAFALWAFSLFGVPQSPLVTGLFAWIVRAACYATEGAWLAVNGITAEQLAQRLMSSSAAHLLIVLIIMVLVLFLKLTLTSWIQAGRWMLNMAGLIADAEDTQQTGAPEFPVAVRTQLLVGEASYAIQDQPAYAAAFTKMEHMEEDVYVQVVLKGPSLKYAEQSPVQPSAQYVQQHTEEPRVQPFLQVSQPPWPPQTAASNVSSLPASTLATTEHRPAAATNTSGAVSMLGASTGVHGAASVAGSAAKSIAGFSRQQHQPPYGLQAGSRPGSNGSNASDGVGSSYHQSIQGSRRNSGRECPTICSDESALGGFDAAGLNQARIELDPDVGWPSSARLAHKSRQTSENPDAPIAAVADATPAWGVQLGQGVASQAPGNDMQDPAAQLSAAQRFRKARTNQVVPIPEEYLFTRNILQQD